MVFECSKFMIFFSKNYNFLTSWEVLFLPHLLGVPAALSSFQKSFIMFKISSWLVFKLMLWAQPLISWMHHRKIYLKPLLNSIFLKLAKIHNKILWLILTGNWSSFEIWPLLIMGVGIFEIFTWSNAKSERL